MSTKKPAAAAWIAGGEEHRPRHEARAKAAKSKEGGVGGRPKSYEEPTARLNLLLPASLVRALKIKAMDEEKTPGQIVAAILMKHLK